MQFSNNLTVSNALCMYHALGDSIVKLIPNLCMLPPVLRTTFSMRPPKEIICKGTNPFPSSWLWHAQARKYEHVNMFERHLGTSCRQYIKGCTLCSNNPPKRARPVPNCKGKTSNPCNPGINREYKNEHVQICPIIKQISIGIHFTQPTVKLSAGPACDLHCTLAKS